MRQSTPAKGAVSCGARRTMPTTSCPPRSASRRSSADPTLPVAPVMAIRMVVSSSSGTVIPHTGTRPGASHVQRLRHNRDTSTPGSDATKDAPLMSSTPQAHLHAPIRTPLGRSVLVNDHVA